MKKNMYETRVDMVLFTPTGKEKRLEAGTLVATSEFSGQHGKMVKVSTTDGKASIEITKSRSNTDLKVCSLTMKEGEILVGEFKSEYHMYHAFGYNVLDIVNRIVHMYNGYAYNEKYTARRLALDKDTYNALYIYKVPIENLFMDEEYNCLSAHHENECIGDYFSKYRTANPYFLHMNKDYFEK